MKKLIFLLLMVALLTACGHDKENDKGAVHVIIKEFGGIIDWPYETE